MVDITGIKQLREGSIDIALWVGAVYRRVWEREFKFLASIGAVVVEIVRAAVPVLLRDAVVAAEGGVFRAVGGGVPSVGRGGRVVWVCQEDAVSVCGIVDSEGAASAEG